MGMNVYEIVTEKILAALSKGVVPWRKPWATSLTAPRNLITGKPYRGMNVLLLGLSGFASPFWATFKQIQQKGGMVKAGSRGTMITFWRFLESKTEVDESGKPKRIPMLRYYTVFNLDQTTLTAPQPSAEEIAGAGEVQTAEQVIASMQNPPKFRDGSDAHYSPKLDEVVTPPRKTFKSTEGFYSTLFHEVGHATGHKSRLARPGIVNHDGFGSEKYGKEELVAEMTAGFLCAETGIEWDIENAASYIENWSRVIKSDPRMVVTAAGAAQRAADYVLNRNAQAVAVVAAGEECGGEDAGTEEE